jgi:hypothetical protein
VIEGELGDNGFDDLEADVSGEHRTLSGRGTARTFAAAAVKLTQIKPERPL